MTTAYTAIMPKFAIAQANNPFVMNAAATATKSMQTGENPDFQFNTPNSTADRSAPTIFNNCWLC